MCECQSCLDQSSLPEPAPALVQEVVEGTQKTLADNGWCKGSWHNDAGEFCVLGAVDKTIKELRDQRNQDLIGLRGFTERAILKQVGVGDNAFSGIPDWNDYRSTTRAEVDRVLAATVACLSGSDKEK
jgi:hypothetical protein